jgi:predicted RNA-binding Zn-ribbon protein involved in translation (DUF1610 family)
MIKPKKPVRGSLQIETVADGSKRIKPLKTKFVCRNCGQAVNLKRKSLTTFFYKCEDCSFEEATEL